MSDLPLEGRVVEENPKVATLSLEQQLEVAQGDIRELARGINTQGALLESIVIAFDGVVKKYLELTRKYEPATAVAEPESDRS